jgi:hypothetical protein
LKTGQSGVRNVDAVQVAEINQLDAIGLVVGVYLLHEKHESNTWHQTPVNSLDQLLVQGSHLLFAEIPKQFKPALNLLWSDAMVLNSDLLELGVRHLLVDNVVCHVADAVMMLVVLAGSEM